MDGAAPGTATDGVDILITVMGGADTHTMAMVTIGDIIPIIALGVTRIMDMVTVEVVIILIPEIVMPSDQQDLPYAPKRETASIDEWVQRHVVRLLPALREHQHGQELAAMQTDG